jgi:hypothetical protein
MAGYQSRKKEKQYQVIWSHGDKGIEFVKWLEGLSKLFWIEKIVMIWE